MKNVFIFVYGIIKTKMFWLSAILVLTLSTNIAYSQYGAWQYRSPVRIIENSGTAKTNYQVRMVVNTAAMVSAGQLDPTGKDLRFGDCTNPSQYNFWIESGMNTTNTEIWVLLPTLPANDTVTVFMYYGNNAAVDESNFDSTFTVASRLIVTAGTVALSGTNNYSWFEVQAGATITVTPNAILTINARKIIVAGTIDGDGAGHLGGPTSQNGQGLGGGYAGNPGGGAAHGGTGGYGAAGGTSGPPGPTQFNTYGTVNTMANAMGSGGGSAIANGGQIGGNGGGAVSLIAGIINVSGIISMNGDPGVSNDNGPFGSGGGAGGGIVLKSYNLTNTGTIRAIGGQGGQNLGSLIWFTWGGGGGGGGRIKLFYQNTLVNPGTVSAAFGIGGLSDNNGPNTPGGNGGVGSIYTGTMAAGEPTIVISPNTSLILTSSDADNSICAGTSVTFTATAGLTNYKFMRNTGTILQSGASNNYTTSSLVDNDTIYVISVFDGCADTSNTIIMNVDPAPISTATNTGAYCEGQTIQLNSSGGVTYAWTGPGGYSNATQNPTRPSSTVSMGGVYTVTVTNAAGCTSSSTTNVVVNAAPIVNATNSGPYCEGATIQLNSVGGLATDDWAGPSAYSQTNMQNPTIASATLAMSGIYTVTSTNGAGCSTTSTTNVVVNTNPTATATNTGPYCEGATIQLNSAGGSATDDWAGPNSYVQSNMQNPTIASSTIAMSGLYTVTVTNAGGCTATATTNVVVNANPIANATNTGPYCEGATIQLNSVGGSATDDWAGPNAYSQTDIQNPTIAGSTTVMSGLYTVSITDGAGCSATATTNVIVNANPIANATNTGPYCEGATIQLNSVGGSASDDWAGPNSYFQLDMQNPTIANSTMAMSGTYGVLVTNAAGCTATSTTNVVVNANPIANATNTGPYCEGATIQLNSIGGSASDDWTGPNSYFQLDMQNPTIANSTTAMSGTYAVLVTNAAGCTATATTNVVVNANPIANATNSGPYCEGSTIQLNSVGGSATDDWTGPNAYVQTDMQNPTIASSTVAMSGLYSVTVTNAAGCSATATTDVMVNANPIANATNTGPYCEGSTIQLNSVGGTATDDWAGPNTYSQANMQNPAIASATVAMSGIYTVTVTNGAGCTATATTNVVVNANPIANATNTGPYCAGSTIQLNSVGGSATDDWAGPNAYVQANMQNPTIASSTVSMSGLYTVTVTNASGCSATATTNVVVNASPTATASSNSPLCNGQTLNLTSTGGMDYDWTGPGGYVQNNTQNPSIISVTPANDGTYTVVVTDINGCSNTATTSVVVNSNLIITASSNSPVCVGSTIDLSVTTVSGGMYGWSGPNSFTSTTQNPSIVSSTMAMAGTYTVIATNAGGCTGTATVNVVMNNVPVVTASSNSPVCEGDALNLMSTGGSDYDWTGPNSYVQNNMQNPSINPVTMAGSGSYIVTVTDASGCSATASTSVTVNANPITPTISQSGDTLLASPGAGFTYQWFMNGNPIAGATSSSYLASTTGSYSVIITNANGCSSTSANFSYVSTVSIQENQFDANVNVYPNPSAGYVNISFTEATSGHIEIMDLNGRIIRNILIPDLQTLVSFDVSEFAAGIYQIKIATLNYTVYKRLIIK